MLPLAPVLIHVFPTWMVSSSLQYSRTLSISKTWSGLYWHSSSMKCSVMQGGKCIRSWLMPSLEEKRHRRLKSNSSPEVWLERIFLFNYVLSFILNTEVKKSGFKRKITLFLLVTGAGGLLVGIASVLQHILLMPQYKLDYQRPLWRKIPAQTLLQQFYDKEVQRTHLISSMKPYGLWVVFLDADHLFVL